MRMRAEAPSHAPPQQGPPRITAIEYGGTTFAERELANLAEWSQPHDRSVVTWINVDGIPDRESLSAFGERLGLHPLALEDIMHTVQRPKVDDYDTYLFVIVKMLSLADGEPIVEQVSIVIAPQLVVSFQEEPHADVFNRVRDQLRTAKGRVRQADSDHLAYELLDAIVDGYFVVLERLGDEIDAVEEIIVSQPTPATLHTVHGLKRRLVSLRTSVWPLRDAISQLEREESPLITAETRLYLRDVYDHTIQVIEAVETYRDITSGLTDIYLSSASNRLNEVMKVLTVIATIFIPLTFITSVYGMNFEHMPELGWRYGYLFLWVVILVAMGGMLLYFRRRGWI